MKNVINKILNFRQTPTFSDPAAMRAAIGAGDHTTFVESTDFTASPETLHVVVANATATDFTPPVEGKGYSVLVWNGTATVGGVDYSTKGTIIERRYHSGSWTQKVYVDSDSIPSPAEATESANGLVEWATEAEVLGVADVNAVVRAKHMRVKVETGNGNAISIGDLGGNARGSGSVTIQASRSSATQVASGTNAVVIGNNSTASGYHATAIGYNAVASGDSAVASGNYATASGNYATASGYNAVASGDFAKASGIFSTASGSYANASGSYANASGDSAVASGNYAAASGNYATASGFYTDASQANSGAFGYQAKSATANVQEFGYWSNSSSRNGAVRVHGTGMVAMTLQNSATAYTDGGATAGSEADNTVIREGFAIRRNGDEILIDINIGGTVKTLSLGTAA